MKLRCVTDSIRIRLRKSDVAILSSHGIIEDHIAFPDGSKLSYGIRLSQKLKHDATFLNNSIMIDIPKSTATEWIDSKDVSIKFDCLLSKGNLLQVLIEKDFPCKHTGNDYQDTFFELQSEILEDKC